MKESNLDEAERHGFEKNTVEGQRSTPVRWHQVLCP